MSGHGSHGQGNNRIHVGTRTIRIRADYAALARLAAAANIEGAAGVAEVKRFTEAVIDPRDRQRWTRAKAQATPGEIVAAQATAIALVLAHAARSGDPEMVEWAGQFRQAIMAFRAGNRDAFRELAYSNMLRWSA